MDRPSDREVWGASEAWWSARARVGVLRRLKAELPDRPMFAGLSGTRDNAENMRRWASEAAGARRDTDAEMIKLTEAAMARCLEYVRAVNGPSWRRQQISPAEWRRAAEAVDLALTELAACIDDCISDAEDDERSARERYDTLRQLADDE